MKTAYEYLPFLPALIAEEICGEPYTGREWGLAHHSPSMADRVEAARQKMTPEQVERFCQEVDARCQAAYAADARWFLRCVRAPDDSGLRQLYIFVRHWLSAYLLKPQERVA